MKLLSEHNREARDRHNQLAGKPCMNGIACPDCGAELFDSSPLITLTSNPPQKNIHCEQCKYFGYRIA